MPTGILALLFLAILLNFSYDVLRCNTASFIRLKIFFFKCNSHSALFSLVVLVLLFGLYNLRKIVFPLCINM